MVFILRAAFWIAVVAAFVPAGFSAPQDGAFARETTALLAAPVNDGARSAQSEAAQFCETRPEACEVGGRFAAFAGLVADIAGHQAQDWLETQAAPEHAELTALIAEASVEPSAR